MYSSGGKSRCGVTIAQTYCFQRAGEHIVHPLHGRINPNPIDFEIPSGLERDHALQVIVTALDPSKTGYTISDLDSVSLTRQLALGLQKTSSYVEGATGTDTIEYSFEVRKP